MSPQPIKTLIDNPSINLVPERVAVERPEVATWISQGILNWTWIDTQIANLFIYLLGSNIRQGAEMYASFESDRVKEKTLRSVGAGCPKQRRGASIRRSSQGCWRTPCRPQQACPLVLGDLP